MNTRFNFVFCLFKITIFQILLNSCFNTLSVFYNISRSGCIWNNVAVSFVAKFIAGCFEHGKKSGLGCSRNVMFPAMVCWCVFKFQESCISNFYLFKPSFCELVYTKFSKYYLITCIRNPVGLLGWSFLQKQLTTEDPCRNLHLRCFTGFLIRLCAGV